MCRQFVDARDGGIPPVPWTLFQLIRRCLEKEKARSKAEDGAFSILFLACSLFFSLLFSFCVLVVICEMVGVLLTVAAWRSTWGQNNPASSPDLPP